ncbi:MAG: PLP-dependent transferase [Candidatus Kapabacteria bacterium]|nr:PLP-dependent transferase [Candidatus Kapabacteria bacterium]
MHFDTRSVHAAAIHDEHGSVASPIILSTTFERNPDGTFRDHLYSRYSNPNRTALEAAVANLESGGDAGARGYAFASGLAASAALLQTLQSGDHVLLPDDVYHGVFAQVQELFTPLGITFSRVDMSNSAAVANAMRTETKIVWMETPSNPMLKITDIAAVAAIARDGSAISVCDNTWATPVLQRPLALGCDVVLHSATKYIGGHSDVLQGVLAVRGGCDALHEKLTRVQMVGGAVPSPFECWLAARGLMTMPVRVRAQAASAEQIALWLSEHPAVERVLYPGLATHPGYDIAKRQMSHAGAMLSFMVRGSGEKAMRTACSTTIFTHATSLGAVESLIEHRASVEGIGSTTPDTLLRLSIGLEHTADLIADLDRALAAK